MAPMRIGGLATGMDTDTIVQQLMMAKKMPIDQMKQRQTLMVWKRDAYREMNTLMSQLKDAADKVRFASNVGAMKATSDSTKVSATATSSALGGTYTMTVHQMATAAKVTGGTVASTTTLNAADAVLTVNGTNITIAANSKVTDVVAALNKQTGTTGVRAIYDNGTQKLSLVNTKTGSASAVNLSGDAALLTAMSMSPTSVTGQSAKIDFNGTTGLTFETNTFSVGNMNVTIKQAPDVDGLGNPIPYDVNLSVEPDTDKVFNDIKAFVDKYNEITAKIREKLSEEQNRSYRPLTDDQKKEMKENEIELWEKQAKSGLLRNDMRINNALDVMRKHLSEPISGIATTDYNQLSDIGITTAEPGAKFNYRDNGKLYIDETKLKEALATNPDQVTTMLTKFDATDDMKNGFAHRIYEDMKDAINLITDVAGSTASLVDKSTLGKQITDYNKRIDTATAKLARYEQQYYSQFAALESAIKKSQDQGAYLSNYFGSMQQ